MCFELKDLLCCPEGQSLDLPEGHRPEKPQSMKDLLSQIYWHAELPWDKEPSRGDDWKLGGSRNRAP